MKAFDCAAYGSDPAFRSLLRKCTPEAMCEEKRDWNVGRGFIPGCTGITAAKAAEISSNVSKCWHSTDCLKQVPMETLRVIGRSAIGFASAAWEKAKTVYNLAFNFSQTSADVKRGAYEYNRRFQCLNNQYKYRVACEIAGGTFAAVSVGGAVAKIRVAPGAAARSFQTPTVTRAQIRNDFVEQYENKTITSAEQNRAYMQAAARTPPDFNTVFFDVENAKMQVLNNTIGDKSLVTSLTNLHKQFMMRELRALRVRNPGIEVLPYSDFKALRYAFKGKIPKDLQTQLNAAFSRANAAFADEITKLKVVRASDPAETWFKAGCGDTCEKAAKAAREARKQPPDVQAVAHYSAPAIAATIDSQAPKLKWSREGLEVNPRLGIFLEGPAGQRVPSRQYFDLLKNYPDPEKLAETVRAQFGIKDFTATDAQQMQAHANLVKEWSAPLLIPQRTIVNLDAADNGGFTADLLNVGTANDRDLAASLAKASTPDDLLRNARSSEQRMTTQIQARLDAFKRIVGDIARCSGDDCVGVPKTALTTTDKQILLDRFAADPMTREIRLGFVPPGIRRVAERTQLATQAELIEKQLRKSLEGLLPRERLQNVTFGIEMNTTVLGRGDVGWLAGVNGAALSSVEKSAISEALAKALDAVNRSGAKTNYRALPAR